MVKKPQENEDLEGDRYEGYCFDLAKKIAELVQFNYELRLVEDGKFGAKKNHTWNGMMGELISGVRIRTTAAAVLHSAPRAFR